MKKRQFLKVLAAAALAASHGATVRAAEVLVTSDIAVSETWTAANVYRLQRQIYVLPGATLTIEAGTVVASTAGVGGSLAVTQGAKIYVNGTCSNPVVMTSTNDVATWAPDATHPSGGDPKTGAWREAVNEWGNLTIMGKGLISASHAGGAPVGSNTKLPTGMNVKQMEGLVAGFAGDPKVMYGGADDNDDSGSINYLSLRYGGKVVGLGNELNGLSLGGIGRGTDIDHVDIMNNVDDGVEIWGGAVNLKHLSIWNIGDDSLDVDQGWRGKAQFGLIVQGHSADANQGSGVGDNAFETDGAEDSDAQPVTTSTIYNFTVVGQPLDGDHGTAWRDNARIQYRNCIFMELGERLVSFDNIDGDGAQGYGFGGTLTWPETWTTPAGTHSAVNAIDPEPAPGAFNHPDTLYTVQTSGTLAEMSDSVFFNNLHASAYNESNNRGVTIAGGGNPALNNVVATRLPIAAITRGALVVRGGKNMLPVTSINPLAANDALASAASAPDDGFFTPANFRGGFDSTTNWLSNWTAASAFGMTTPVTPCPAAPVNNASLESHTIPSEAIAGQTIRAIITMRNTGTSTWTTAGGYALAVVTDGCAMAGSNRIALTGDVAPGGTASFERVITAPETAGACAVEFRMIQEGVGNFGAPAAVSIAVGSAMYAGFAGNAMAWSGAALAGQATVSLSTSGLCMTTPAEGDNVAGWVSPERYVPLKDNTVYRVTLSVSTDQATPDAIPFVNFIYNNFNASGLGNNFGGESWFLDVQGGANGIGRAPQGRSDFVVYVAPNAMTTPQWRGTIDFDNSAFAPAADSSNDIGFVVRLLDQASSDINAGFDSGMVCARSLRVESLDATQLAADSVVFNPAINTATHLPESPSQAGGGSATIDNATATANYALAASGAGSRKSLFPFDPSMDGTANMNLQLYPVVWETNALYRGTIRVRSNAGGGAGPEGGDPLDSIFILFDTPTVELGQTHYSTRGSLGNMHLAASPRLAVTAGGAQTYTGFFHGQNATLSGEANAGRLRMFAEFFNTPDIGPDGQGADPFTVEAMTVEKLITP